MIVRAWGLVFVLVWGAGVLVGCDLPDSLPPILYLRADDAGRIQLYRQDQVDATPRRLSGQSAGDVVDFAPSPDGRLVVYTVADGPRGWLRVHHNSDGSDDRELLPCPDAECSGPVWSPDGARMVSSRRPLAAGGAFGSPRLYWLEIQSNGATLPLVAGEVIGYGARSRLMGCGLATSRPAMRGWCSIAWPMVGSACSAAGVGRPAAFSPDSAQVIVSDLVLEGNPTAPDDGDTPRHSGILARLSTRVSLAGEGRERLSADLPGGRQRAGLVARWAVDCLAALRPTLRRAASYGSCAPTGARPAP